MDMGAWVAANQPRLHPTRRKVLTVMADLTRNGRWTNSSKVRAHTGLSQQLLNRHLRALQDKDLVELENPGPGLPLNARVTNAGPQGVGAERPKNRQCGASWTDGGRGLRAGNPSPTPGRPKAFPGSRGSTSGKRTIS